MVPLDYSPGDIVETSYGVGVISNCPSETTSTTTFFYTVLLWRQPGKSIGSSSIAHLHPNAVRPSLPYQIYIDKFVVVYTPFSPFDARDP